MRLWQQPGLIDHNNEESPPKLPQVKALSQIWLSRMQAYVKRKSTQGFVKKSLCKDLATKFDQMTKTSCNIMIEKNLNGKVLHKIRVRINDKRHNALQGHDIIKSLCVTKPPSTRRSFTSTDGCGEANGYNHFVRQFYFVSTYFHCSVILYFWTSILKK